jgi:hypothetical protein
MNNIEDKATRCYDCIVVAFGTIVWPRLGMPSKTIKAQTDALFGTGQGNGASPAI